jgi:hypothetical protein
VKREARGLPLEEARARLARALTEHDVVMPDKQVDLIARALSDPWWATKHPIRAWREVRQHAVVDPEDERIALEEEARQDAEMEALSEALSELPQVVRVRSSRSSRGTRYTVTIHPWSEAGAEQVRNVAHPIVVTVEGLDL